MPPAGFQELAERLVERAREAVHSGAVTERGLARLAGYSQPHVHNVLHGKRKLNPEMADALLASLPLSLSDLLSPLDSESPPASPNTLRIPALSAPLGGGSRFPKLSSGAALVLDRRLPPAGVRSLVAAQVHARERAMRPLIEPGDWVVLDRDPVQRTHPDFAFVYALEIGGRGFLARCRLVGNCLVTVTDAPRLESGPPRYVELEGYAGAYVRGLVVWVSRRM